MSGLSRRAVAAVLILGMIGSVAIAGLASLFASTDPDGLERVAQDQGIAAQEQSSATSDSPLADYGFTGVENEGLGAGISLVAGLGITLVLGAGLFWAVAGKSKRAHTDGPVTARHGELGAGDPGGSTGRNHRSDDCDLTDDRAISADRPVGRPSSGDGNDGPSRNENSVCGLEDLNLEILPSDETPDRDIPGEDPGLAHG